MEVQINKKPKVDTEIKVGDYFAFEDTFGGTAVRRLVRIPLYDKFGALNIQNGTVLNVTRSVADTLCSYDNPKKVELVSITPDKIEVTEL